MSDEGRAEPSVHNSAERVEGVQAGVIYGGVHFNRVQQQPDGPRRYGVVPSRVDCFQNRAVASELAATVKTGAAAVLTGSGGTSVLSGLGGVGKTQLAADYAESVAGEVDLLVWITAVSRQAILAEYAAIIGDLTGFQSTEPEAPARRFLAYLTTFPGRWLVVLDDVQSPGDLRGLWPPVRRTGRVVVTTRRRDAAMRGRNRRVIDVDTFTPAESLAFLEQKLGGQLPLLAGAAELAGELGHLPLALGQAAAYLLDWQISCAEYRERLVDRANSLASLAPEWDCLPENQRAPVARTWLLSVLLANELRPAGLAKPLLELASVLDPNGIPGAVFTSESGLAHLARGSGRAVTAVTARDALGCLHRLSLINHEPRHRHRAVRVHALVQRVTRENLFEAQLRVIARSAADALVEVWPGIERDTELAQVLRANSEALHANAGAYLWAPGCHRVLFRTARSLGECGRTAEAAAYLDRLRDTAAWVLGPGHVDTIQARISHTIWLAHSGGIAAAITELRAVVRDSGRFLGADHPATLRARHNLAYWLAEAGDLCTAVTEFQAVFADRSRILGPDHPATLHSRQNLAHRRAEAGDITTAVAELQALSEDQSRVLGPEHPATLRTHHTLAYWRAAAGDLRTALTELETLLANNTRVLGPDHPSTLDTRHNLAFCRGDAGDAGAATTELHAVLADRTRILGPDHPATRETREALAYWQKKATEAP